MESWPASAAVAVYVYCLLLAAVCDLRSLSERSVSSLLLLLLLLSSHTHCSLCTVLHCTGLVWSGLVLVLLLVLISLNVCSTPSLNHDCTALHCTDPDLLCHVWFGFCGARKTSYVYERAFILVIDH